jgi:hypothetical protein
MAETARSQQDLMVCALVKELSFGPGICVVRYRL